jgi:hypothetical protein
LTLLHQTKGKEHSAFALDYRIPQFKSNLELLYGDPACFICLKYKGYLYFQIFLLKMDIHNVENIRNKEGLIELQCLFKEENTAPDIPLSNKIT